MLPDPRLPPDPREPGDGGIPNAARVYDYFLGGGSNFAADRKLAAEALALRPLLREMTRSNRAFLHRAVRWCLADGIVRYLDLGSGIPTVGNVHEIVLRANDSGRVVYVDREPIAVAHARALLHDEPRATVIQADLRDVDRVLADHDVAKLLAPGEPVALVLSAVLHFLVDADDPGRVLARYLAAMPAGSVLVLSHGTSDGQPEESGAAAALYRSTATPLAVRTRDEVAAFLDGVDLVEPGLVFTPRWRPKGVPPRPFDEHPEQAGFYGAVGRIRRPSGES